MKKTISHNKGFTLVEIMIATGLFVVVVTIGITAVLNINRGHKKTQAFRTAFDNLSFIMEDMSRNVRLGSNIHCTDFASAYDTWFYVPGSASCVNGNTAIVFTPPKKDPGIPTDLSIYAIGIDPNSVDQKVRLYHAVDGGAIWPTSFTPVTPGDITIDPLKSGFIVIGADPNEPGQTRVTIRLAGIVTYRDITTPFDLQTTVSARLLDQ